MFVKIDKKILLIIMAVLIVVLIAGFFVYKYSKDVEKTVENTESNTIDDTLEISGEQDQEQLPVNLENIQIETQSQPVQSGLTICVDKCGDGICEPAGTICDDSLNCTCAETKTDCPDDCK